MEDDQSKVIFENILNFKSKKELLVLNSVRQLGTICKALGQERTVQELLPFLQDLLEENSVVVSDLLKALVELPLDLSRPASPDNKEAFAAVCYFFEEACTFQERLIRLQPAARQALDPPGETSRAPARRQNEGPARPRKEDGRHPTALEARRGDPRPRRAVQERESQ